MAISCLSFRSDLLKSTNHPFVPRLTERIPVLHHEKIWKKFVAATRILATTMEVGQKICQSHIPEKLTTLCICTCVYVRNIYIYIPWKSNDQFLPIGSRESFTWIILKTSHFVCSWTCRVYVYILTPDPPKKLQDMVDWYIGGFSFSEGAVFFGLFMFVWSFRRVLRKWELPVAGCFVESLKEG